MSLPLPTVSPSSPRIGDRVSGVYRRHPITGTVAKVTEFDGQPWYVRVVFDEPVIIDGYAHTEDSYYVDAHGVLHGVKAVA